MKEPTVRFQFSIRTMLVTTAGVALAVGAVAQEPSWQSCLVLVVASVLFPSLSINAAVSAGGPVRRFWIGMSVVLTITAIGVALNTFNSFWSFSLNNPTNLYYDLGATAKVWRLLLPICWMIAVMNGIFCVWIPWILTQRDPRPYVKPDVNETDKKESRSA